MNPNSITFYSFKVCGCIIEDKASPYYERHKPMFGIGVPELLLILVLALIIFGPGKLPDVGKAVGKALGEFRNASREIESEIKK